MANEIKADIRYIKELLKKLISINSVLPHEQKISEFLAEEIRSYGIEPEWHEVAPSRPNVYATANLGNSDKFLIFSGHQDTVGAAAGWKTDPFKAVISDSRMYGLGSINMKSGLACMLGAFKALVESNNDNLGRVGLAICCDQEGHSIGAKALLKTEYGECDAMLHAEHFFGDSKEDYLPIAVTGKVLYKISVKGQAGHAFRPHEGGINAIMDASKIINALESIKMKEDPLFGKGTICVLKVDGGYKEYAIIVPEHCEIIITRLTVPGETVDTAEKDMLDLVNELKLNSNINIEMSPPTYNPYSLDEESEIMDVFKKSYKKIIGKEPYFAPHRGIVDANVFTGEGGIPNIVFGPKGGLHHQAGEYVELHSLQSVTDTYIQTAIEFLKKDKV